MNRASKVDFNNESESGFLKSLREALFIGLSLVAIVISTTPDDISGNGEVATARPGELVLLEEPHEPSREVILKDWSVQLLEIESSLEEAFADRKELRGKISTKSSIKSSIKVVRHEDPRNR